MKAWGTAGWCHQLQSGGVLREVFDSDLEKSLRSLRLREVFDFEKSSTPEALSKVQDRQQLGRTTRVKVQVHGVAKDGLS